MSLHWKDDKAFNARYHALEDVYLAWRSFLHDAHLGPSVVDAKKGWAAWFVEGESERLLCVVGLEPAMDKVQEWIAQPPRLRPCGVVKLDVVKGTSWSGATLFEIPLQGGRAKPVSLSGNTLVIERLPRQGCRLFRVRRAKGVRRK